MANDGAHLLSFINQVRGVQELDMLWYLNLLGTDPDHERECVLGQALNCRVGASAHPTWDSAGRWVMRFDDLWTTRTVGIVTEQEWLPKPLEVHLPDELVDFAVALRHGLIETDELGFIEAWFVPCDGHDLDQGFDRFELPEFGEEPAIAA